MSETNDGGPAFPNKDYLGNMIQGMTLRDWFAGQALAGLVSSWYDRYAHDPSTQQGSGPHDISLAAYAHADAMIAAREKGGSE